MGERHADDVWKLMWGDGPDDWTDSCSLHIGEMFIDGVRRYDLTRIK
jgi:hypothetical protein